MLTELNKLLKLYDEKCAIYAERINLQNNVDSKNYCLCHKCGSANHNYMVHDNIWKEAGFHYRECVCFNCLSVALKRSLSINDFTVCVVNVPIIEGYRIALTEIQREIKYDPY